MTVSESWSRGGAYESYIGRWSRVVADEFIRWLAPASGARWLDVGCGTGALTNAILREADPAFVRGEDPSEAHVAHVLRELNKSRTEFGVGDARSIEAIAGTYDYVVSGLVMNFVPDPRDALAEMSRVAKPGGVVAGYVWDYSGGMEMLRIFWDAAGDIDPRARVLDEGERFPLCAPEPLRELWEGAGLRDVEVIPIVIPTTFTNFDDYWAPFLGGQGPAPGYNMSLSETDRTVLRERLRERLGANGNSPIELHARAWAIRGDVP